MAAFFAPFVFLGNHTWIIVGVFLWGIGIGAQDSVMRAVVAHLSAQDRLALAYGLFHLFFGIFWFLGSFLIGVLYDYSVMYVIVFSVVMQLMALPFLFLSQKIKTFQALFSV